MLGVVVAEVQGPVVAEQQGALGLEAQQPGIAAAAVGLLLDQLLLHGDVVDAEHRLGHGVVGRVDVNPEPSEAAVKVRGQVVSVNILVEMEHGAGGEQMVVVRMMMMLADIRDIDVGDPRAKVWPIPSLLCLLMILITRVLAGSVILLIIKASVGAVRGLKMIILGVGRPGNKSSDA